ncbi:MAG: M15 family metallopeptidase [Actinomycetota bacterium]
MAPVFLLACNAADRQSGWKPKRIDSYACRSIRGSSSTSLHSHGLAWDFFATDPGVVPPGGVWKPLNTVPTEFAAAFESFDFYWGRRFSRQDWPHIEYPGPPPKLEAASEPTPGAYVVPQPLPPPVPLAGGRYMRQMIPVGKLDAQGRGHILTDVPWDAWVSVDASDTDPETAGRYGGAYIVHPVDVGGRLKLVVHGGAQGETIAVYVTTV